jgi:hypothetical protein
MDTADVVTTWIVVQHPDAEHASKFRPGRWIQIDEERMQIIDIEQLKDLQDRILVARFPTDAT